MIYRLSGVMHVLTGIAYWDIDGTDSALLGIPVTAANLIGLLIGFGFLLFSMVCISEAFKKQFAAGKNLRAAYKSGFADATVRISNGFALLLFGFVVLIASGAAALENLAYGYGVALVLAYLCAMLISRPVVCSECAGAGFQSRVLLLTEKDERRRERIMQSRILKIGIGALALLLIAAAFLGVGLGTDFTDGISGSDQQCRAF